MQQSGSRKDVCVVGALSFGLLRGSSKVAGVSKLDKRTESMRKLWIHFSACQVVTEILPRKSESKSENDNASMRDPLMIKLNGQPVQDYRFASGKRVVRMAEEYQNRAMRVLRMLPALELVVAFNPMQAARLGGPSAFDVIIHKVCQLQVAFIRRCGRLRRAGQGCGRSKA